MFTSKASTLILIIFSIIFYPFSVQSAADPAKLLTWFGYGEAVGNYREDRYQLNENIKGLDLEYNEYQFQPIGGRGWSRSFFVSKLEVATQFKDIDGTSHKFRFDSLTPHWGRGYGLEWEWYKKHSLIGAVDWFLGLGLVSFTKDVGSDRFDRAYGYDISYGYAYNLIYKYDDQLVAGWRRRFHNNRIRIEYADELGFLTHRSSTIFFLGLNLRANVSCVPTAYVSC